MFSLALCLSLLAPGPHSTAAEQDVLVLKSGRRIAGECLRQDDQGVVFVDQKGNELRLVWSFVRDLEQGDAAPDLFSTQAPTEPEGGFPDAGGYVGYRAPATDAPGALTTGISRWHHVDTDTTLFLVGAVHIAEPPYFQRLQRVLDSMDVVLFEGIKPDPDGGLDSEALDRLNAITQLQLTMNRLLGLTFQKDGVEYDRNFWRNSDVNASELQCELDRQGVQLPTDSPLFKLLIKLVAGPLDVASQTPNPELELRLRRQMAPVLAKAEQYTAMPQLKGFMDVVVDFRNQRVMEDLQAMLAEDLPGRRAAIFYGSAHLPDFEQRLGKEGWVYQGCTFLDAWTVR